MGRVYLGVSRAADRVAVKVIRTDVANESHLRERFATEVDTLRRVYGARVARFEGAGIDNGQPWLAVEYVPGPSLKEHVEMHGPLAPTVVAMLGALLAEGLGKIHQEGLLHRDLKPQTSCSAPTGRR
jgi:serine/threonine protein kinase